MLTKNKKMGHIQVKKVKNNLFIIVKDINSLILFSISFGSLDFSREKRKTYYAHYILALKIGQKINKYKKLKYWNLEVIGNCLHKKAIFSGFINNTIKLGYVVFKDLSIHGGCKKKKKKKKK